MSLEVTPIIECGNCIGACCRQGVMIHLTEAEAAFLKEGGTLLETIREPHEDKRGIYGTLNVCGYLAIDAATGAGICTVFDSTDRPAACSEFQPDSEPCNYMRRGYGIAAR